MRLGIHMMTHNPETMRNYVLNSLDNLRYLATEDTTVGLSFNGDKYNDDIIQEVIQAFKSVGFKDVKYIIQHNQDTLLKEMKLIKFRQNSINLLKDCDAWLILDDDMKFGGENLIS